MSFNHALKLCCKNHLRAQPVALLFSPHESSCVYHRHITWDVDLTKHH